MGDRTLLFSRWFRGTFIAVGCIEASLGVLSMASGVRNIMDGAGVSADMLASPHYQDAIFWVVLHMTFIGCTCIAIGSLCKDLLAQVWLSRLFTAFHAVYAFLDVRASESPLGTALYHGPKSIITPAISCALLIFMLHLAIRSFSVRANG